MIDLEMHWQCWRSMGSHKLMTSSLLDTRDKGTWWCTSATPITILHGSGIFCWNNKLCIYLEFWHSFLKQTPRLLKKLQPFCNNIEWLNSSFQQTKNTICGPFCAASWGKHGCDFQIKVKFWIILCEMHQMLKWWNFNKISI